MKRILIFVGIGLVLMLTMLTYDRDDVKAAEKPKGTSVEFSYVDSLAMDTTVLKQRDTTAWVGLFTEAGNYGTITGWWNAAYNALDTGSAAADIPDTTKDTVILQIRTIDDDQLPWAIIYVDTAVAFKTVATTTYSFYRKFNISDSAHFDNLQMRFISAVQDSDYDIGRLAGDIEWKFAAKYYAK